MESQSGKVLIKIYKWKYSRSSGPQHDSGYCNGVSWPVTYLSDTTQFKKAWSLLIKEKVKSLKKKRALQLCPVYIL